MRALLATVVDFAKFGFVLNLNMIDFLMIPRRHPKRYEIAPLEHFEQKRYFAKVESYH